MYENTPQGGCKRVQYTYKEGKNITEQVYVHHTQHIGGGLYNKVYAHQQQTTAARSSGGMLYRGSLNMYKRKNMCNTLRKQHRNMCDTGICATQDTHTKKGFIFNTHAILHHCNTCLCITPTLKPHTHTPQHPSPSLVIIIQHHPLVPRPIQLAWTGDHQPLVPLGR